MCMSPNSGIVRRTIDLNYDNKQRASSLKWILVNGTLFFLFVYDLSCKCPGYTSVLHYVELGLAGVAAANLVQHSLRLLPRRRAQLPLTPRQQRLLGLQDNQLDSSFRLVEGADVAATDERAAGAEGAGGGGAGGAGGSLSPPRVWRARAEPSRSPPSPPGSPDSPDPRDTRPRDEFIADRAALADFLKEYEERARSTEAGESGGEGGAGGGGAGAWGARPAPRAPLAYQLSAGDAERAGGEAGGEGGAPPAWRRLQLDPQRLTHFNLNLRLWLHVTILERLVREMGLADEALAHGGHEARLGGCGLARLEALAAAPAGLAPLRRLLPFLRPFAEQQYLVRRIRELARGGCLSEYRWNGGGSGWDEAKPTDAELVLHLLAVYLDGQLVPAAGGRPFSETHVSAAPAPPPRGPRALAIHRVTPRPPHYVLALGDDTVEVSRGRNNLLHTILLFLAAAARREPPALGRLHLGRAGLNMLWIIGR